MAISHQKTCVAYRAFLRPESLIGGHALQAGIVRRASCFSESKEYQDFAASNSRWLDRYGEFMAFLHANRNGLGTVRPAPKTSAQTALIIRFAIRIFSPVTQLEICRERMSRWLRRFPYVEYNSADYGAIQRFRFGPESPHAFGRRRSADYSARRPALGSPTYRWDRIAQNNFRWWVDRFRFAFEHLDLLRVDHFRGFEAFWSVPAQDETARNGHWVPVPVLLY